VELREQCRSMPDPQPLSMFDNVYAELTPLLEEQRAAYAGYLAGFLDQQSQEESANA
jgi:2-oxoisovalerate dehydrogenase E1 component alpha subunit